MVVMASNKFESKRGPGMRTSALVTSFDKFTWAVTEKEDQLVTC